MFKLGKLYKVVMWEDGADGGMLTEHGERKVIRVDLPLVEFEDDKLSGKTTILNTASLAFVSAQAVDSNGDEEYGSAFLEDNE